MEAAKLTQKYVKLLRDEEVLMTLQRRYPSVFSSILSTAGFMLLVYWWSIVRYIVQYSGFLMETLFTLIYSVIFAIVCVFVLMLLLGYFYVRGHLYILTNRRIILFRKFVMISVRELTYHEITDLIVNQGPLARWLNYGSITPLSPGVRGLYALPYPYFRKPSHARVELKDVSNPFKIVSQLFDLTRTHSSDESLNRRS
ncbi:MAG: PH domain-containing protein [Candidatus Bathyarchaeia archaeon]|nr:PH domain-containing protein [Candidatus Bathyarchaeota archaeon]